MSNKERIIEEFQKIGKDSGNQISEVPCAKCGEEEAYVYKDNPTLIFCPRQNHCGEMTRLKDYFPELSLSQKKLSQEDEEKELIEQAKHYATTKRGIYDYEELGGEYCVLTIDGKKYPALRARLEDGESFNYRVIGHPTKKAHFDYGKPIGNLMFIPKQNFSYEEIWIAESPLKAMALVAAGKEAIGMTSTSTNILKSQFVQDAIKRNQACIFVLALDNDEAGRKATKKWSDRFIEKFHRYIDNDLEKIGMVTQVAIPPDYGVDWDDYLKRGNLKEMLDRGQLLGLISQADTIQDIKKLYAENVTQETIPEGARKPQWWPLVVEHKGMLWKIYHKEKRGIITHHSHLLLDAVFRPGYNYTVGDELDLETITIAKAVSTKGKVYNIKITPDDRVNPAALRKKLSAVALLQYNPFFGTHDYLINHEMRVNKTATVRHIERTGYDKESDCYVFPTFAVTPSGKCIKPNTLGFFPGIDLNISKDLVAKAFSPDFKASFSHHKFLQLINQGWGNNGVVLLSYYISAYFSHIKCSGIDGTFPFVSFEGAPGTGKSTLISLLNLAFNFFASEGRAVNKTDTKKGLVRDLAKFSSLCVPILENRKEKDGKELLAEDMFLNLYARLAGQTTAIKSMNLETRKVPFDACLILVWNHNTLSAKEVRDRFINLKVEVPSGRAVFNQKNKEAKDVLKLAGTTVSAIGLDVLRKRNLFERDYLKKINLYRDSLQEEGLQDERYKDNFAHLFAVLEIYQELFLREGTESEVFESRKIINSCMADLSEKAKKQSVETLGDAGIVTEFWEAFQQKLSGVTSGLYDDRIKAGEHFILERGTIYIRPKKVFSQLRWEKQEIDDLKIALQRSHLFRGTHTKRCQRWNVPEGQAQVFYTWAFDIPFEREAIFKATGSIVKIEPN